jgi:hypothetical protein
MRPMAPGDILVLVRKRDGFVPTLLRTLKAMTGYSRRWRRPPAADRSYRRSGPDGAGPFCAA